MKIAVIQLENFVLPVVCNINIKITPQSMLLILLRNSIAAMTTSMNNVILHYYLFNQSNSNEYTQELKKNITSKDSRDN